MNRLKLAWLALRGDPRVGLIPLSPIYRGQPIDRGQGWLKVPHGSSIKDYHVREDAEIDAVGYPVDEWEQPGGEAERAGREQSRQNSLTRP